MSEYRLTCWPSFEARSWTATLPTPHKAYGLCAVGLSQFKAAGLAVVYDHTRSTTFYPLSPYFGGAS